MKVISFLDLVAIRSGLWQISSCYNKTTLHNCFSMKYSALCCTKCEVLLYLHSNKCEKPHNHIDSSAVAPVWAQVKLEIIYYTIC